MDVSQTANDLQGFTTFNAPIVNQREANTSVSVLDGETIVLGGIIRNTVTATSNKVPILGDIPIIGNLFKSTTKTNAKTELLVLLTPRIVRDDEEARKLRIEQENRLSKPTREQLRGTLPPAQTPTKNPNTPDNDPGSGAGDTPGKMGDPPPATSPMTRPPVKTDPPKTEPQKTGRERKTPPPTRHTVPSDKTKKTLPPQ